MHAIPEIWPTTVGAARRAAVVLAALLLAPGALAAQQDTPDGPAVDPADVESPDAIVAAVYESISGAAGEERAWDRFRALFVPGARLIPSGRRPDGTAGHEILTVEEYIEGATRAFAESGFFETEIHAESERYGDIAHVFSTYESRHAADDAEPFQRGINSFQLWHDGDRWWIVNIFWHAEREDAPIPERYGG